jgi:hypothetical protein
MTSSAVMNPLRLAIAGYLRVAILNRALEVRLFVVRHDVLS